MYSVIIIEPIVSVKNLGYDVCLGIFFRIKTVIVTFSHSIKNCINTSY